MGCPGFNIADDGNFAAWWRLGMLFETFAIPAVILVVVTALLMLFIRDWRLSLTALGIQYIGVFALVGLNWPLEMAVVKLVTGWIAAAVLGMELISETREVFGQERFGVGRQLFRVILAILVGMAIFSLAPEAAKWMLQASYEQILGGFLLIGLGILHLGVSDRTFRVILGILTTTSGFEILYGTLDASPVGAGLLALIILGIALVGSYLLAVPSVEAEE
jgi:hypothetical protein